MQFGTAGCSHLALRSVTGSHLGFRTAADPTQATKSRELSAYIYIYIYIYIYNGMSMSSCRALQQTLEEHIAISDAMLASIMGEDWHVLALTAFTACKP